MSTMETLNERNTETVEQALKEMDKRIFAMLVRIDGLNAALGTMIGRMEALERMVIRQKVEQTGHGPTSL